MDDLKGILQRHTFHFRKYALNPQKTVTGRPVSDSTQLSADLLSHINMTWAFYFLWKLLLLHTYMISVNDTLTTPYPFA